MDNDQKEQNQTQTPLSSTASPAATSGALGKKELEPTPAISNLGESIRPSEPGPQIPPELSGIVEPVAGPTITSQAQQAGVQEAGESVPPFTEPIGIVRLPTKEEIEAMTKGAGPFDSKRWLGVLSLKVLKELPRRLLGSRKKPVEKPA